MIQETLLPVGEEGSNGKGSGIDSNRDSNGGGHPEVRWTPVESDIPPNPLPRIRSWTPVDVSGTQVKPIRDQQVGGSSPPVGFTRFFMRGPGSGAEVRVGARSRIRAAGGFDTDLTRVDLALTPVAASRGAARLARAFVRGRIWEPQPDSDDRQRWGGAKLSNSEAGRY